MQLPSRTPRVVSLAGWLLLLLGHVCPQAARKDNSEICLQPPLKGPCRAIHERWFYDRYTQTCEKFTYGGCEGNANNFLSEEDCEKTCWMIRKVPKICRLESDEGMCRALIPKYFFNLSSMACEKFYYGGCLGNDNRFDSKDSCMDFCLPQTNGPSFCYSPKDEGTCSGSVTRFYYNRKTKTCEKFIYTGCGGNENNFARMKDCIKICKKAGKKSKRRT
ncbi:PREDICTED: tissue factor pathway inhibitor 2 isoform X2 [Gekko japonicus]|uniref:Tissue factor pathway inhibitor 2 isoform X2 n=1 Tax=Gekko japonicus TaxID=146911 RepID=A0ABM1KPQ0_GEKJA|nr:PREDICTED: tissue factor pathway inhibitor 2 isoform X2 [Gekko japonicus]